MLTHNLHNVIIALYIIVVRIYRGDIMYRSKDLSVISIIGVLSVIRLVEDEFVL